MGEKKSCLKLKELLIQIINNDYHGKMTVEEARRRLKESDFEMHPVETLKKYRAPLMAAGTIGGAVVVGLVVSRHKAEKKAYAAFKKLIKSRG